MRSALLRLPLLTALFGLAVVFAAPTRSQAQAKQLLGSSTDVFKASAALAGSSGPRNVTWIDSGTRFAYIVRDTTTHRDVIRRYEPATGRDTLLFSAQGLTFPGGREPFEYQSFRWAQDSKHLVFQTHFDPIYRRSGTSDYYVYTLADRSLTLAAHGARSAEISPDGSMIGFERDGDMYIARIAAGAEKRLTSDATEHVYNGHFDWVYEEEFGLAQAWKWSPDSRHIAFWQTNDTAEPTTQLSSYAGRHPDWEVLRIPQPGDSNATVRIGVVDVSSGKRIWLATGERGDFYIPRIYWTSRPDTLAVMTLNRRQNEMALYFFDVKTGGKRLVMSESSKTWIDVQDSYAGTNDMVAFPAESHEFFWISDRDGWPHVYRYDYSGRLLNQVTHGGWSVTRIEGIDVTRHTLYFSSTNPSPLQRQLYEIHFDGTRQRRLTTSAGNHRVDMSPNTQYYIDRWSSVIQPRQVALYRQSGALLRTLEQNDATTRWLATHAYSTPELFRFTTSDGVTLDGSLVRPYPFDSTRKYPVIFTVYGGPGAQDVYDVFDTNARTQWLAQHGYIVVDVNNRGTNNYGSAFSKIVYGQLGKWESHDFAETAKYLMKRPYVDGRHIAITGTSYGGYSTLYTMEMYPDIFTVGVENSGVADWRLYDSIYSERYMGLLGDNPSGYDASSALLNAAKLTGHLLVIHSMMDDNVHPQNTMQLLTAFADAGKDVPVRLYPPGRHGAFYNLQSYLLIDRATDDFFAQYLFDQAAPSVVH